MAKDDLLWDWASLPTHPAATYIAGSWYPVLESGILGQAPVVLTRPSGGYSSHLAAYAQARDIATCMLHCSQDVMNNYKPTLCYSTAPDWPPVDLHEPAT